MLRCSIHDGTGLLVVSHWMDPTSLKVLPAGGDNPVHPDALQVGEFVVFTGVLSYAEGATITAKGLLRQMQDHNELTHHFLWAILTHKRGTVAGRHAAVHRATPAARPLAPAQVPISGQGYTTTTTTASRCASLPAATPQTLEPKAAAFATRQSFIHTPSAVSSREGFGAPPRCAPAWPENASAEELVLTAIRSLTEGAALARDAERVNGCSDEQILRSLSESSSGAARKLNLPDVHRGLRELLDEGAVFEVSEGRFCSS